MKTTTVITCNIGDFDHLRTPLEIAPGARYVCYADRPMPVNGWQIQPAYQPMDNPKRNSRIPKILSHLHCDTEYSIWHDCCFTPAVDPCVVVDKHLRNADIALFRHPARPDLYQEAMFCRQAAADHGFESDLVDSIDAQCNVYRAQGYPGKPFVCGGVIIRRENEAVRRFNKLWWREYQRWGVRDQFSLNYALWKSGVRLAVIEHYIHESPMFSFTFHASMSNQVNDEWEPIRLERQQKLERLMEACK